MPKTECSTTQKLKRKEKVFKESAPPVPAWIFQFLKYWKVLFLSATITGIVGLEKIHDNQCRTNLTKAQLRLKRKPLWNDGPKAKLF